MQVVLNHPHVVNNCIKKHINIPVYSQSSENVLIDEYVQGQPIYQQPVMFNQSMINQQMVYSPNQYQGNVVKKAYNNKCLIKALQHLIL